MKKRSFYLLMLLVAGVFFSSCSDSDKFRLKPEHNVDGIYFGALDVDAAFPGSGGVGDIKVEGIRQKIHLSLQGERTDLVKLELEKLFIRRDTYW